MLNIIIIGIVLALSIIMLGWASINTTRHLELHRLRIEKLEERLAKSNP
jgi:hypothetical protein